MRFHIFLDFGTDVEHPKLDDIRMAKRGRPRTKTLDILQQMDVNRFQSIARIGDDPVKNRKAVTLTARKTVKACNANDVVAIPLVERFIDIVMKREEPCYEAWLAFVDRIPSGKYPEHNQQSIPFRLIAALPPFESTPWAQFTKKLGTATPEQIHDARWIENQNKVYRSRLERSKRVPLMKAWETRVFFAAVDAVFEVSKALTGRKASEFIFHDLSRTFNEPLSGYMLDTMRRSRVVRKASLRKNTRGMLGYRRAIHPSMSARI